ncbi:MAG: MFS transporter [Nocardioides sp.]|uniref:MFS transporter n=1 Tax=Nocardioides sp. TaxID=35761 RepID=UPI0039E28B5B
MTTPIVTTQPAEPTVPVERAWIVRFGLVWLGVWMSWLVPVQLALPEQLDHLDHLHRYRDFGIINAVAGVVTLVGLPICGALCDRTRSRIGRRRIWVIGGVTAYAAMLVLTGYQSSWPGLALTWGLAAAAVCAITAGMSATVADEVPDRQRGVVSGVMFGPQSVGLVLGLVAVGALSDSGRYWALAAAMVVLALPFALRYRDLPARAGAPTLAARDLVAGLWVDPRRHPDFGWAFGSRLLVNVGNALGTTYLYFFLKDDLEVGDPDGALLELSLVYVLFTLLATVTGSVASDRTGRRKVFVAVAAALQGAAAILLALLPSLSTAFAGAALLGAGYGAFVAVDQALVTAVLPNPDDRAKDLGILNVGSNVPQALGPLMAAAIVAWVGFGAMFLAAGAMSLVGAVMVRRVRAVR